MGIICPNCQHEEQAGAKFCSECKTEFVHEDDSSTLKMKANELYSFLDTAELAKYKLPPIPKNLVSLFVIKTGNIFPLVNKYEFSLGRNSRGQVIIPDIDLTSCGAYIDGVSRLHAEIKVSDEAVYIKDLNSTNGTRVNGTIIVPPQEYPLNNGDLIALGKLKIRVIIQNGGQEGE